MIGWSTAYSLIHLFFFFLHHSPLQWAYPGFLKKSFSHWVLIRWNAEQITIIILWYKNNVYQPIQLLPCQLEGCIQFGNQGCHIQNLGKKNKSITIDVWHRPGFLKWQRMWHSYLEPHKNKEKEILANLAQCGTLTHVIEDPWYRLTNLWYDSGHLDLLF